MAGHCMKMMIVVCAILSVAAAWAGETHSQAVAPGDVWQVDCSWRIEELPRTAWIHPELRAFDAAGRQVFFRRDAGNYIHRTFDLSDPYVERWRFYVQVKTPDGGNAKVDRRFSMGLATLVIPAESARFEVRIVAAGDTSRHSGTQIAVAKLDAPPPKPQYSVPSAHRSRYV